MRVIDDALLALLETTGLDVNDGVVDADNDGNTVTLPVPYLVYTSSLGDDRFEENTRLSGDRGRLSVFFSVMYVGSTREQAKAAGERVRAAFRRQRVSGAGIGKSWLIVLEESQRIRRADDAISPTDRPLFYGVDNYAVSVTLNSEGVPG